MCRLWMRLPSHCARPYLPLQTCMESRCAYYTEFLMSHFLNTILIDIPSNATVNLLWVPHE